MSNGGSDGGHGYGLVGGHSGFWLDESSVAAPSSFCQNTWSRQQASECIYIGASLLDESIAPGEEKFPTSQFHIDKISAVRIIVDLLLCTVKQRTGEEGRRGKERALEY